MPTSKYLNVDITSAGPALGAAAVTASDSADLPRAPARGLWVGTAGTLKLDCPDGSTVTLQSVPAGLLPIQATRIYATGTTASNIVALY